MPGPKNTIVLSKPDLFVPSVTRNQAQNAQQLITTGEEVVDTNIASSASFRYDPPGVGLRSSQQLDVDWSRFENHTFFSSAETKISISDIL